LWQEGIARYIELRTAKVAGKFIEPSADFAALEDYQTFEKAAEELREAIKNGLKTASLNSEKRVAFYPFGAAMGLLLDETNQQWKRRYLNEKFQLQKFASSH